MNTKNIVFGLLMIALCPAIGHSQFVQEKKISKNETYTGQQYMNIVVINDSSDTAMDADVHVDGLNSRKKVTFHSVTDTTIAIKNYRLYTVSCILEGFMYYSDKFWPEEKQVHVQSVRMKPLEVGLKTDVMNISFLGDQTAIYHKSKPTLQELKSWLDKNPTVEISVIGHVNGPDNARSKKFYNRASQERAQAVVDYLVELGVDESRLTAEGKGNTEMRFPDPKTDWQNEANRRVEILITAM